MHSLKRKEDQRIAVLLDPFISSLQEPRADLFASGLRAPKYAAMKLKIKERVLSVSVLTLWLRKSTDLHVLLSWPPGDPSV